MEATVTPRPFTAHDYYRLPEAGPRYQLIEGELHMAPAPNRYHQTISRNIEKILLDFLDDHPLGIVYNAPFDVQLTDTNVYQPDVLFLRQERRSLLTEQGIQGAPDLVVEILSPKTVAWDTGVKRDQFARCGTDEMWIVDPEAREIQVFHLQENADSPQKTVKRDGIFESRVLPGLSIPAALVFQED